MNRLYGAIARHAVPIVVASCLLTVFFANRASHLRVEHDQSKYLPPPSDPAMRASALNRERFLLGQSLIVGLEFAQPIGLRDLAVIDSAARVLQALPGIRRVTSLIAAVGFKRTAIGTLPVLLFPPDADSATFASSRRIVQEDPLYTGVIVSRDWTATALLVEFGSAEGPGRASVPARDVDRIEALLRPVGAGRFQVHLAGTAVVNRALQDSSRRDVTVFGGLSGLFCLVILAFLFRRVVPVLLAGGIVAACVIWTMGLLSIAGAALSAGLAMIVPLTIVLCAASCVHYLAHWIRPGSAGPPLRYLRTMHVVFPPNLFTGVTSAFGFATLAITPLESVREVGIYAAVAVAVCMVLTNLALPAAAWLLRRHLGGSGREGAPYRMVEALSKFVVTRRKAILVFALVTSAVWAVGLTRLSMDADPVGYFRPQSPLRRAYEFVNRRLGGTIPIEIVVEHPAADLGQLGMRIQRLERDLRALEGVGACVSAVDMLAAVDRGGQPPTPDGLVPVRVTFARIQRIASGSLFANYVWHDSATVALRVALRAEARGAAPLRALLHEIEAVVRRDLPGDAVAITGQGPVLLRTYDYLVSSQLGSFPFAFIAFFVCVYALVRSRRLFLAAVAVNLYPLISVGGVMGWSGVPLDIATIMIASITLGLVVDDTVHFLFRYIRCQRRNADQVVAMRETYAVVGPAMVTTAIVLTGGFLSLAPSDFVPTSRFGWLSALAIATAYIANLVLLPALLLGRGSDESPARGAHEAHGANGRNGAQG